MILAARQLESAFSELADLYLEMQTYLKHTRNKNFSN
jgi:hypothetical protein